MTDHLAIALAQIPQTVGALTDNADAMRAARARFMQASDLADLLVFPEMQLIGYPAEDLVVKPALVEQAEIELTRLATATADGGPAMLVGTVYRNDQGLHNGVALLADGRVADRRAKHELPNYGTFDEKRIFAPGPLPDPIDFKGVRIGVPICEDLWFPTVAGHLKAMGAEILLCPNASPFEIDKDEQRLDGVGRRRVAETGLPLAYVNRVGGQDELVFDGASFVLNPDSQAAWQFPDWEAATQLTQWHRSREGWRCAPGTQAVLEGHPADTYHAMMLGLRAYVAANRFPGVILGLSGGIDSALSAAVAVDALGADRVWCVRLPSRFTASISMTDAQESAQLLGCRLDTVPIGDTMAAFSTALQPLFAGRAADLAEENLQARIRGTILMALSNKFGPMVLTTGNKSELSVGYATLYGDMCGGYSVLKDAYKTTVFALSHWRNAHRPRLGLGPDGPVMPERTITRPPSAELRADQKDEDSLPPYDLLDPILRGLVEEDLDVEAIARRGFDRALVARIEAMLYGAEYKRRQSPPGVKLGKRNFGRDRRYPITNRFRTA